jgi:hypothetical protein
MVGGQRLCGDFGAERHYSTGFSTAVVGKLAAASAGNLTTGRACFDIASTCRSEPHIGRSTRQKMAAEEDEVIDLSLAGRWPFCASINHC